MKKLLCFIISLIMLFPLAVACDNSNDKSDMSDGENKGVISLTVDGEERSQISMLTNQKINVKAVFTGYNDTETTWSSSDNSVLQIKIKKSIQSYNAEFLALSEGTSTVTATATNGDTAVVNVTVSDAVISVSVEQIDLYLCKQNDSFDLNTGVTVTSGGKLSYKLSSGSIASITNGVIKPLKSGTTYLTITETNTNKQKEVKVVVHDGYIDVLANSLLLTPNEEADLPFASLMQGVVYNVENTSIAMISNGKIKGLSVGTTTVTATYDGETKSATVQVIKQKSKTYTVDANMTEEYINYYGRNYYKSNAVYFCYGASGFEVSFYGTELSAYMYAPLKSANFIPEMQILVDGESIPQTDSNAKKIIVDSTSATKYSLVSNLKQGYHTVKVLKRSSYISGNNEECIAALTKVETNGFINVSANKPSLKIDIYGDSITHGYGNLTDGSQPYSAITNALLTYGYLTAEKLNAQVNLQGHSGWCMYLSNDNVVNKPTHVWGDKYLNYNPKNTTKWDFSKYQADVIVINIGTNDGFGISAGGVNNNYSESGFIKNYKSMVEGLKAKCPNAKFVLCYGMMGTNQTVWKNIKAVADSYDYAYALNFTDYRTTGNHPLVKDHVKNAEQLYNKINEII